MTLATVGEYRPGAVPRIGSHAVVVGGSIAGLLAARVLADGYDRVTLLERDAVADAGERRGVPQADHVHVLLESGRAILEALHPGYRDDLTAAGGLVIDAGSDLDYHERGDYLAETETSLPMCCASRPLFERVARRRTAGHDGVAVRPGCRVTDYLTDGGTEAVTGVAYVDADGTRRTAAADLVVDATGRTSRTGRWLEAHGYPAPPRDTVEVDLAYSTVAVRRPPGDRRAYLAAPSAPEARGGTVVPVEGDRWLVTLFGMHGSHPPADRDGVVRFAEGLPVSGIADVLTDNAWVSDGVARYPFPSNCWRHYERLDRFPDGLLVTGDAVASFNPIYGQGMSVAALDAVGLHAALTAGGDDLAPRFFDRIADHVGTVWRMAVGADFEFPDTSGPKPPGTELRNRYRARLIETAHRDARVSEAFARVLRLEAPPRTLLRPGIAARVLLPSPFG